MKLFTVFLLLLIGYAGLIAVGIGIDQLIPLKEAGFAGKILFCLFLTGIFFYPPVSFSYFFSRQLNSKFWRYGTGLPILCGTVFFVWTLFGFQTGSGAGKDNLVYPFTGAITGFILSTTIIGCACLSKHQTVLTRSFGFLVLISPGYWPLMINLQKSGLIPENSLPKDFLFNPFLLSAVVILLALISALSNPPSKPEV